MLLPAAPVDFFSAHWNASRTIGADTVCRPYE
jgi:hypothetical protein